MDKGMNTGYRIRFTHEEEAQEAEIVSFELLYRVYEEIKKKWVRGETGYSKNHEPAEYFSRSNGGFAMVIKMRLPAPYTKKQESVARYIEFVGHSPEELEQMVSAEAGLPFKRNKVTILKGKRVKRLE